MNAALGTSAWPPALSPGPRLGAAQSSAYSITRKGPTDLIVEALRPIALATAGSRKRRSTMTRASRPRGRCFAAAPQIVDGAGVWLDPAPAYAWTAQGR
jgi:hypothetical protein